MGGGRCGREKCESHLPSLHPHRKKVGAQSENGKSWAPGTPRLARLVCMASSDPLPGPDAKSPAFPNDFFSHELERLPALAGACAADGTITKRHNHQAAGEEAISRARRCARHCCGGSGEQGSREAGVRAMPMPVSSVLMCIEHAHFL